MQLKSIPEPSEANDRHRPKARSGSVPRRKPIVYQEQVSTEASTKADDYFKKQANDPIIELSPDRPGVSELASSSLKTLKKHAKPVLQSIRTSTVPAIKKAIARFKQSKYSDVNTWLPYLKDRRIQAALGAVGVVAIFVVLISALGATTNPDTIATNDGAVEGSSIEVAQPDFDVVAPTGSATTEVKYDPTKNVASTAIVITGFQATLSQQLIDLSDSTEQEFLIAVAQSYGLSVEVQSEKGGVFIGSNAQEQVTTAVFIYQDFLFFIRSSGVLDDQAVIDFVNTLR